MDIKDFIEESLLQIVDGIANANKSLGARGSYIPNKDIKGEGGYYDTSVLAHVNGVEHYLKVDFDIAVIVDECQDIHLGGEAGTKGASLKVAKIIEAESGLEAKAEGIYESGLKHEVVHRIKCSIPLALPEKK
jgi:hypothetical protein